MLKDLERSFGILIARWHTIDHQIKLWNKEYIEHLVQKCVVLHNMAVETQRDDCNSFMCSFAFVDDLPV